MTLGPGTTYPYGAYRFHVEIEGLVVAGFSEVSGIQSNIEVEEYREGGVNGYIHKLPKLVGYPNIVLKRGITDSDLLWNWYSNVTNGVIKRKSGSVILYDYSGKEKWRWNFTGSYPVKWTGPELKADSNVVSLESLELVHTGLTKG